MGLSPGQLKAITIAERTTSVISLLSSALVVGTFLLHDKFRKSINRLVFYATLGNMAMNSATVISTRGYKYGINTPLCHFQAFFVQWFMTADVLWIFAMACNVWLSFFRSYNATSLRRLEVRYLIMCYGVTFIPAFALFFISSHSRGKAYGSAVLHCWISVKWGPLREAVAYVPIWIVILMIFGIYIHVGIAVLKWRNNLRSTDKDQSTANAGESSPIGTSNTKSVEQQDGVCTSKYADASTNKHASMTARPRDTKDSQARGGIDPDQAALRYCKVAVLFFIALTITWIPSTINRMYVLSTPDETNFGLNISQAVVLPLQGFWNSVIYFTTSPSAVRSLWDDICHICWRKGQNRVSFQMRQGAFSLPSDSIADQVSNQDTHTRQYDGESSTSQRGLVDR